jgi:hypothetical protein
MNQKRTSMAKQTNGETFSFADEPPPKSEHRQQTSPLLEILLDWLLNRWPNPTISARDVYRRAPSPIYGNKETTLHLAETLARQGWLIPIKTWRRDRREWKIARSRS